MSLRIWRFVTLTLIALSMVPAMSHALELWPKMQYDPALYLTLHRTLYEFYGKIGGIFEIGAVVAAIVLAYMSRHDRPTFAATAVGATLMVLTHASYWIWVAPMNSLMAGWPVDAPPADWMQARNQWEYTHLARFFLQLFALLAIEVSAYRAGSIAGANAESRGEPLGYTGGQRRAA